VLSRVAQLVEQVTVNHRVGGSSPSSGASLNLLWLVSERAYQQVSSFLEGTSS
jgi:hypothetical protein